MTSKIISLPKRSSIKIALGMLLCFSSLSAQEMQDTIIANFNNPGKNTQ